RSSAEPCGHDADYRVHLPVQHDLFSDDVRVGGESLLPEGMAEDDDVTGSRGGRSDRDGFILSARAAHRRAYPKETKQTCCRPQAGKLLGAFRSHGVYRNALHEGQRLKRLRARSPLEKVERMNVHHLALWSKLRDKGNLTGVGVGKRLQ